MAQTEKELSWVAASKEANMLLFSELDVLLRALGRFFAQGAHLASKDDIAAKNFRAELNSARDAILRILGILEVIIPENRKNAYWFRKYAESKLMEGRSQLKGELQKQDSPEKSLYLLYDSFINLKGVVTDVLRNQSISYMSFRNIGEVIGKHITDNAHFNPFSGDINRDFDAIDNKIVSDIVKKITEKDVKKAVSIAFLELFKLLRYLSHIDMTTPRYVALHSSLLILVLLKSEIDLFRAFAERASQGIRDKELAGLFQSLSYQFSMEGRRVFSQELGGVFEKKAPQELRGRIENSHGILKNLIEQSAIQLAHRWNPDVLGEEMFDSFVTRLEQSLKLREDIYILHSLLSEFETGLMAKGREHRMEAFRHYMVYFESFTFKLLRHDDYEAFSAFFAEFSKIKTEGLDRDGAEKISARCSQFKIFLETTLGHIANRAELAGRPLDVKRAQAVIRQYRQA